MDTATLAIFPLKLVLFPESIIPLHIFEQRYIGLIKGFVNSDLRFGINLNINEKKFDAGCDVNRVDIIRNYDDGRMDINVVGGKRYYLKNLKESEYGYLTGEVDFFDDESDLYDLSTLASCLKLYNDIAHNLKNDSIKEIKIDDLKTIKPSFLLAQKTGLTPLQKQQILELKSENDRLISILKHLEKIIPIIKEAETVSSIIKNDGYLKQKY